MATVDDVMRISAAEVGYSRYTDPLEGTKYGRWYAELTGSPYFGTTGVHYCAMFVSWVFDKAGVVCRGFPTASCTGALLKPAWAGGYLVHPKDLRRGDAVLFDWSGAGYQGGNADHVGIVRENMGSYLLTREGNVSGAVKDLPRELKYVVGGLRPSNYEAPVFSDVAESTPHYADIKWLKEHGIAAGYADGSFKPYGALARADAAAFLHRLDGKPVFSDVNTMTSHAEDIWWMAARGISTGYPDGTFRPSKTVARADLAAFLYRMAGEPEFEDTSSFTDVAGAPHEMAIRWLGSKGIAKGYSDGTFRPYSAVTRGDAAAFIRRSAS